MTTPIIIAHRGLNAHAPENTLAAYAAALDLRLGFEVDVRETADNELVLLHDTTLDRTTDGSGELNATPFDELRRFDAGAWFDPAFAGQRVPTLDDTLSLASERKNDQTLIALDFKPTREGVEHRVCEMLERYELIDRVIGFGIIYTEASMRRRFKVANPSFPTARWIRADNEWRDGLTDPDSDWLYLREIPSREAVNEAHDAGKRVVVSGPVVMSHRRENWLKALDVGIDALNTDYPLECRKSWRDRLAHRNDARS